MSDATRILQAIEQGDPQAAEQLLPVVYDELRKLAAAKLANEKPGQTLRAAALVHEAYIRLVDAETAQEWDSRGHFFAAAAEAMRRILVDRARTKGRLKHGGNLRRQELKDIHLATSISPDDLLSLDGALDELALLHPEKAAVVKLRFFAGLTVAEAANVLGMSATTVDRHWSYARAWLYRRMASGRKATGE